MSYDGAVGTETKPACYPKVRLAIELGASGSVAKQLGVEPKQRAACFDIEPLEVRKMMSVLGWGAIGSGEAELALEAMEDLLKCLVDQATALCGYEYAHLESVKEQLILADGAWPQAIEGARAWSPAALSNGLRIKASSSLAAKTDFLGSRGKAAGAEWMALHEAGAQHVVATMMEQLGLLGVGASLSWSKGFLDWRQSSSKMPEKWKWPVKNGAAYCLEIEDGSVACAWVAPKTIAKIAKSPLGRALGPWSGFSMLSSWAELKRVCGPGHSNHSYSYAALPSMGRDFYFPCHMSVARRAWRGQAAATSEESMAALENAFGPKGLVDLYWAPPAPEGKGMMRSEAVDDWLGGIQALLQARDINKALGTLKLTKKEGSMKAKRL